MGSFAADKREYCVLADEVLYTSRLSGLTATPLSPSMVSGRVVAMMNSSSESFNGIS